MTYNNWVYIAVMAAVSYAIRVLPLTLIRKPIKNQFIQSFLYYVPYVTLAVMTFPAIINATQSPIAGAAALVVASPPHGSEPVCFRCLSPAVPWCLCWNCFWCTEHENLNFRILRLCGFPGTAPVAGPCRAFHLPAWISGCCR